MRIISIINFKGGVGKSTLATNLGHALAIGGRRVLIIDCDLQANSSTLLSTVSWPTLTHVLQGQADLKDAVRPARENLDVVPSDRDLDAAAKYIVAGGRKGYYILRRQIGQIGVFWLLSSSVGRWMRKVDPVLNVKGQNLGKSWLTSGCARPRGGLPLEPRSGLTSPARGRPRRSEQRRAGLG